MSGFGTLPDLRYAMSENDGLRAEVRAVVEGATAMDGQQFRDAVEAVVLEWAGVSDLDPAGRGAYIDGQHLALLERVFDYDYVQLAGTNAGTSNPGPNAGYGLEVLYQEFIDRFVTEFATGVGSSLIAFAGEDVDRILDAVSSPFYALSLAAGEMGTAIAVVLDDLPETPEEQIRTLDLLMSTLSGHKVTAFGNSSAAFEDALRQELAPLADKALLEFAVARAQSRNGIFGTDADGDVLSASTVLYKGGYGAHPDVMEDPQRDVIWSDAGDDTMSGRGGGDTYVVRAGDGRDEIIDQGQPDLNSRDAWLDDVNYGGTDQLLLIGRTQADVTNASYSPTVKQVGTPYAHNSLPEPAPIKPLSDFTRTTRWKARAATMFCKARAAMIRMFTAWEMAMTLSRTMQPLLTTGSYYRTLPPMTSLCSASATI